MYVMTEKTIQNTIMASVIFSMVLQQWTVITVQIEHTRCSELIK